jgi:hypothetical protein
VHVVEGVGVESMIRSMFASIPETEIGVPLLTVEPEWLRQQLAHSRYRYLIR